MSLIYIAKIWGICSFEDWHFFQFSGWFLQTFDFTIWDGYFVRLLNKMAYIMNELPSLLMI